MYESLQDELEEDLQFRRLGGITLAEDSSALALLRQWAVQQRATGLQVELLDDGALQNADMGSAPGLAGALYCPESSWVNPLLVVAAYLRAVRRMGGEVWVGTPVREVLVQGDRVQGVATSREVVHAPWVINAAGLGADSIIGLEGYPMQITPVWGQIVVTERVRPYAVGMWTEAAILRDHSPSDTYSVRLVCTRPPSGNLLIGRCEISGEVNRRAKFDPIKPVLVRAVKYLPFLLNLRVLRLFASSRAFCQDRRALVGLLPSLNGMAILAGFGDGGITLGVAAKCLAQVLCRTEPELDLSAFDPSRLFLGPGGVDDQITRPFV
jgi:sarcosine oxidase subunit beta